LINAWAGIKMGAKISREEDRRVLIIGASGFLGSKLFSALSVESDVIGTFFSRPALGLVYLNIQDKKQVSKLINKYNPHVIIACGGMTRPDECEKNQKRAYDVNVKGMNNLVECSKGKIIYISTDYVFSGEKGPYCEHDDPHPINYYGWTKYEAEKIVLKTDDNNLVLRVSGLYGYNERNNEFIETLIAKPVIYKADNCYSSNLFIDDVVNCINSFWNKSVRPLFV